MATRVKLKSVEVENPDETYDKKVIIKYNLLHDNSTTTLEQELVLTKTYGHWKAEISINDFPSNINNPTEAAHKLSDWLGRLSEVLKNTEFNTIKLDEI